MKLLMGMVGAGLLSVSCVTASIDRPFRDDPSSLFAFTPGSFTYLNQGADFVIESRRKDGLEKAQKNCGPDYKVQVMGENGSSSSYTTTVPMTTTTQHSGTVGSGLNSTPYSGTSTGTTYQQVSGTNNYITVNYACLPTKDLVEDNLFSVYVNPGSAPICKSLEGPKYLTKTKLEKIANAPDSDNCLQKAGWLRHIEKAGKRHLFVGELGKAKCKEMEGKLLEASIADPAQVNVFLIKNLVCK